MKVMNIRLSGSGGQGLITAGKILATAVGICGDRRVIHTQSYGPEARGGASKSDLIISDDEIIFPRPYKVDVLLSLNQESLDKYYPSLRENGTLIIDEDLVKTMPTENAYCIPFTMLAYKQLGRKVFANVIALASINEIVQIVEFKYLKEAVVSSIPEKFKEKNLEALNIGVEEGKKAKTCYVHQEETEWEL
jgi:2-oxoglutarate ferredoxin oxidoreductase subunit gamma